MRPGDVLTMVGCMFPSPDPLFSFCIIRRYASLLPNDSEECDGCIKGLEKICPMQHLLLSVAKVWSADGADKPTDRGECLTDGICSSTDAGWPVTDSSC